MNDKTTEQLQGELAAARAECDKLRGIIYRSTWDRLSGESDPRKTTKEDIEASLEVFYEMQRKEK